MTAKLPVGFVQNSAEISHDIRRIPKVPVEDITKLWKAYTTNKLLLQNDAGIRLENLFWRIWGNRELCYNITGATIAKLFVQISDGESLRTTPRASPRASRAAQVRDSVKREDAPSLLPESKSSQEHEQGDGSASATSNRVQDKAPPEQQGNATDKSEEESTTSESTLNSQPEASSSVQFKLPSMKPSKAVADRSKVAAPQSILKRPRQSSVVEESQGIPTTQEENTGARAAPGAISTSGDSTVSDISPSSKAPVLPTPPRQGQESKGGSRRKKTSFALAGKDRRRPSFVRRKSSQTSTSSIQQAIRSPHAATATTSASASTAQSWVVDRDFRSKFVDHRKRQDQFTDLVNQPQGKAGSTVASSSTAVEGTLAFAEVPETTDFKGKGKARVSVVDEEVPLKPAAPSVSTTLAISGSDTSDSALPRTKSQLTLLLERDRRRSEDASAGAPEVPKARKTSG